MRYIPSLTIALLLGLSLAALPVSAAPPPALPAQDAALTLSVQPAFGGAYRPGAWFPLRVTLENGGADRAGELRVNERQRAAAYALPVDLPRGARKVVTIYARVDSPTRRLSVSFVAGGATLASVETRLVPRDASDLLVGLLAADSGALLLPERRAAGPRLAVVELSIEDMPELSQGLQSFGTLVMQDAASESLSEAQREALTLWVARGGKLLIGGGSGASATLAGLPALLRPAKVVRSGELGDTSTLGLLAGAPSAPAAPLAIVEVRPIGDARVVAGSAEQALLVEREVGRGRVVFFAAAINSPALRDWPDVPELWSALLWPAQASTLELSRWNPMASDPDEFRAQSLASNLSNLPAVDLPSLWLLGSLLLTYILLVGPLAYLVLRRLDRLALGWVILPAITVVFALAAYGVGYALRGGDVLVNQISVVEPLVGDEARVQSFIGIFSPNTRQYALRLEGQPLSRPIGLFGPWGGPGGPVEDGIFSQGNGRISNLSVGQWSMRGLVAESTQPFGRIEATLRVSEAGFQGEIVNNSTQTLRDALLVRGVAIARLGDIPPGERRRATLVSQGADIGMSLGYLVYKDVFEQSMSQPPDREAQRRQMVLDSIYSNGPFPRGPEPLLLGWLDGNPLPATLDDVRVDARHLTLYTAQARLVFEGQALELGRGWTQLRGFDANGQPMFCSTPQGQGLATYNGNVEAVLRLPPELRGLIVEELALELGSDGVWPGDAAFELFDRLDGEWRKLEVTGPGPVPLDEAGRFFDSSSGELRLRFLHGSGAPMTSSCIAVDLNLKGRLP